MPRHQLALRLMVLIQLSQALYRVPRAGLAVFTSVPVASCAIGTGVATSDVPTTTTTAAPTATLPPVKQADENRRLAALAAASAAALARGITKADDPGSPNPGPSGADVIL